MAFDLTNNLDVISEIDSAFTLTDRAGNLDDTVKAENSAGEWCLGIGDAPSGGGGPTADPPGRLGYLYTEASTSVATTVWAFKRNISFNTLAQDVKIDILVHRAINVVSKFYVEYATVASPNETTDWTILETIFGLGATSDWISDTWDFSAISTATLWVRVRCDFNNDFHNDLGFSTWREYGVDTDGLSTISQADFDLDNSDLDLNGLVLGATQGTGKVYFSADTTLAGGTTEIDISAAITSWSATQVNLDLTLLSQSTKDSLDTLGPGARHVILVTNASLETSLPITFHRAAAFKLSLSANIAASGENTTAQLTAPSGKTTADFGGGRIQDDENPTDTIDIGLDEYQENQWNLIVTGEAVVSKNYVFRNLIGSKAPDTISQLPTVTIASGSDTVNGSSSISSGSVITADLKGVGSLASSINSSSVIDSIIKGVAKGNSTVNAGSSIVAIIEGVAKGVANETSDSTILASIFGVGKLQSTINPSSIIVASIYGRGKLQSTIVSSSDIIAALLGVGKLSSSINTSSNIIANLRGTGLLQSSINSGSSISADIFGIGKLQTSISSGSTIVAVISSPSVVNGVSSINSGSTIVSVIHGVAYAQSSTASESIITVSINGVSKGVSSIVSESVITALIKGIAKGISSINSDSTIQVNIYGIGKLQSSEVSSSSILAGIYGIGKLASSITSGSTITAILSTGQTVVITRTGAKMIVKFLEPNKYKVNVVPTKQYLVDYIPPKKYLVKSIN